MKLFYVVKTSPEPAQRYCLLTQKSTFDSMHVPMLRRVSKRPVHDGRNRTEFFFARRARQARQMPRRKGSRVEEIRFVLTGFGLIFWLLGFPLPKQADGVAFTPAGTKLTDTGRRALSENRLFRISHTVDRPSLRRLHLRLRMPLYRP